MITPRSIGLLKLFIENFVYGLSSPAKPAFIIDVLLSITIAAFSHILFFILKIYYLLNNYIYNKIIQLAEINTILVNYFLLINLI